MNQYRWEGIDKRGRRVRGITSKESAADVISMLRGQSIEPGPGSVAALSEEEVAKIRVLDQIDETIYFHCEECKKRIGVVTEMKSVICSECGTDNAVPNALRDAKLAELKEIEEFWNALFGKRDGSSDQ